MLNNPKIKAYWQAYLDSLTPGIKPATDSYTAWYFGDHETLANELGELVRKGIKTATCGMLAEYEVENEPLPQVGDLSIITNWQEEPLCIIETTEVEIRPFNAVDAQFAFDEGEGDRSLAYWRQAHERYFTRRSEAIGRELGDDIPLVCERFRVVFSGPLKN